MYEQESQLTHTGLILSVFLLIIFSLLDAWIDERRANKWGRARILYNPICIKNPLINPLLISASFATIVIRRFLSTSDAATTMCEGMGEGGAMGRACVALWREGSNREERNCACMWEVC